MKYIKMSEMKEGERGRVKELLSEGRVKRRMMDLGFTPEAEVEMIMRSPSKSPAAYLIRGTVIAFRDKDAGLIKVGVEDEEVG